MTIPIHTQRVTRLLRARAEAAAVHEPSEQQSELTIRAMELAMGARKRRSSNVRRVWALAAAAVVVCSVGAAYQLNRRPNALPVIARGDGLLDGNGAPIAVGARLGSGTGLRSANESVTLRYETGTDVTVGANSRVRLIDQGKKSIFALDEGRFSAHVAKLKADERFVVKTSDAEVEVRGTQFSVTVVDPQPGCESHTRVDVTEGVVAVRHEGRETLVRGGEHFPVCVVAATSPKGPPTSNVNDLPLAPAPAPSHVALPTAAATADSSSLSAQNDLFAEAIDQKRKGQPALAASTLATLLTKYPATPLRENALVERMKLLESVNPAQAKQVAREYLRSFPQGFAQTEANRLASEP